MPQNPRSNRTRANAPALQTDIGSSSAPLPGHQTIIRESQSLRQIESLLARLGRSPGALPPSRIGHPGAPRLLRTSPSTALPREIDAPAPSVPSPVANPLNSRLDRAPAESEADSCVPSSPSPVTSTLDSRLDSAPVESEAESCVPSSPSPGTSTLNSRLDWAQAVAESEADGCVDELPDLTEWQADCTATILSPSHREAPESNQHIPHLVSDSSDQETLVIHQPQSPDYKLSPGPVQQHDLSNTSQPQHPQRALGPSSPPGRRILSTQSKLSISALLLNNNKGQSSARPDGPVATLSTQPPVVIPVESPDEEGRRPKDFVKALGRPDKHNQVKAAPRLPRKSPRNRTSGKPNPEPTSALTITSHKPSKIRIPLSSSSTLISSSPLEQSFSPTSSQSRSKFVSRQANLAEKRASASPSPLQPNATVQQTLNVVKEHLPSLSSQPEPAADTPVRKPVCKREDLFGKLTGIRKVQGQSQSKSLVSGGTTRATRMR